VKLFFVAYPSTSTQALLSSIGLPLLVSGLFLRPASENTLALAGVRMTIASSLQEASEWSRELKRVSTHLEGGDFNGALAAADAAWSLVQRDGTTVEQSLVRMQRGLALLGLLRSEEAAGDFKWIIDNLTGDAGYELYLQATAQANHIMALENLGHKFDRDTSGYARAAEIAERVANSADAAEDVKSAAASLVAHTAYLAAKCMFIHGMFTPAEHLARRALDTGLGEPFWQAKAHLLLGELLANGYQWHEASDHLARAREIARAIGAADVLFNVYSALIAIERNADHRKLLIAEMEALDFGLDPEVQYLTAERVIRLGEYAYRYDGNLDAAAQRLEEFVRLGGTGRFPSLSLNYQILRGTIAVQRDDRVALREILKELPDVEVLSLTSYADSLAILFLQLKAAQLMGEFHGVLAVAEKFRRIVHSRGGIEPWHNARDQLEILILLSETYQFIGVMSVAVELAREAILLAQRLEMQDEEVLARLLYAQAWLHNTHAPESLSESGVHEWKEALDEIGRQFKLRPNHQALYHTLYAQGLANEGDYKGASVHSRQVNLDLLGLENTAQFQLIQVVSFFDEEQYQDAINRFAQLGPIESLPVSNRLTAYKLRAELALRTADNPTALTMLRKAVELADARGGQSSSIT